MDVVDNREGAVIGIFTKLFIFDNLAVSVECSQIVDVTSVILLFLILPTQLFNCFPEGKFFLIFGLGAAGDAQGMQDEPWLVCKLWLRDNIVVSDTAPIENQQ